MIFARKVWKLLVAIKDGLALLFLLLIFAGLYAVLSARPGPGVVRDGALLIELSGVVVEEPTEADPLALLLSSSAAVGEYRVRDVVRALRLAAEDDRIEVVALDLSGFLGGGMVHMQEIGEAMDLVRAADKPVLTYAIAYADDGMLLAAHASEVWMDPSGGAFIRGPGGNSMYYGGLLERLKVDARIYRVGTYKDAVEPWTRSGPSDASQQAREAILAEVWDVWRADYRKARPKAKLDLVTQDPVGWIEGADGDWVRAAREAGLIDRAASYTAWKMRLAEIAGRSSLDDGIGKFEHTDLATYLSAHPLETPGKAIGVVTIAGEIVDGSAGPGVAGGDRIVDLLDSSLDKDFAALVLRVDSPGGSVIASERIRDAVARYKERGIPVVVSMANVAASGGYWVSTPADRIFAEPATLTGSVGVFAVVPVFDRALADIGVTGAGSQTTPLSGQPDPIFGLTPETEQITQAYVEDNYAKFVSLVSQSRDISAANAPDWAEGRVWAGGTARQLKLIDQLGGLDDALAFAAKGAGLEEGEWHADFVGGEPVGLAGFFTQWGSTASIPVGKGLDPVGMAAERQALLLARAASDVKRLLGARSVQAYCMECPAQVSARSMPAEPLEWMTALRTALGL